MAPIIEVSNETMETLNPTKYTRRVDLETPMASRVEVVSAPYIEVPELKLKIGRGTVCKGKNWYEAHEALSANKERMLTMPEFVGFLNFLKSKGREYQDVLNEIVEVREPWRAEWIDAFFEQRADGLYVLTQNKTNAEKLTGCLMKDRTPGISLDAWLKAPTKQGFPQADVAKGDLYSWAPRDGSVARFVALADRTVLNCGRYPLCRYSVLGVRAAKQIAF